MGAKSVVSSPYQRLVIPRPNHRRSGYQGNGNRTAILADGTTISSSSSINVDYGVNLSNPDVIYETKMFDLDIRHMVSNTEDVPETNETDVLDLSNHIYLQEINMRSPFLNADNIILPEIVVPLQTMDFTDSLGGYGGANSLTGTLDLTPLNVNGMFGGFIRCSADKPDLYATIIPSSCDNPITYFSIRDDNFGSGTNWDCNRYSNSGNFDNKGN